MPILKSVFRAVSLLVPGAYCGGLIYYFLHQAGSVEDAEAIGLGPTLLELAAIGLVLSIPLFIVIIQIVLRPRSPRSGGRGGGDGDDGFDPDAVIARYKAQHAAEPFAASPTPPPAPRGSGPARPTNFGRKNR